MWKRCLLVLFVLGIFCPGPAQAWPLRIGIGLNLGIPIGPVYSPYPYAYPYTYPAYPPVVVQQSPPVVVGTTTPPSTPPTVVGNSPSYVPADPNMLRATNSMPSLANNNRPGVDELLARLGQSDENSRRDAIMDLGRMKADRAIDPLTSSLANDKSPVVRDAAARALGLIGASRSLPALIRAAQADNDRDVRHSAQFAIEIIRSQMQR